MFKNITNYYESKDFLVCSFEILDVEEDKIDKRIEEIKKIIPEKWIRFSVIVKQNIKFNLWVSNKREFRKAKESLLGILKNNGFNYGNETIFGDGTATRDEKN